MQRQKRRKLLMKCKFKIMLKFSCWIHKPDTELKVLKEHRFNWVFSDEEDSSLGATLGLILVAILVCVGIGVGVYFGVAAILNSVKQNRKFWQIFPHFEIRCSNRTFQLFNDITVRWCDSVDSISCLVTSILIQLKSGNKSSIFPSRLDSQRITYKTVRWYLVSCEKGIVLSAC